MKDWAKMENTGLYTKEYYADKIRTQAASALRLAIILNDIYRPSSVIDFGCGSGLYIHPFVLNNIPALGIERSEIARQMSLTPGNIRIGDLSQPIIMDMRFDLALCLEVAEHIDQQHETQLFDNICQASDTIIFGAAIPGQPGVGHINCQKKEHWLELFSKRGFELAINESRYIVRRLRYGPCVYWLPQNIMVLQRKQGDTA